MSVSLHKCKGQMGRETDSSKLSDLNISGCAPASYFITSNKSLEMTGIFVIKIVKGCDVMFEDSGQR